MRTVLVVDDASMFRTIMKRHLNQLGFEVLELESGKDVVKWVNSHEIEAILLDIIMDEQEGLETITQLMALPKRPKIIATSSNETYLRFAIDLGAEASLTKPVSFDSLKDVLHKLAMLS